ncbi:MAG: NAD(P)/FAD-dependent oxidoreductase [Alphaproteobacteria bacterium]|nr:NAD(P)/FAD-dependent oxidoreductase [Alphaproteobacteria bacterium]
MGDNSFDPDKLLAKYRSERDKRVRKDGIKQYREIKGEFAHFLEDPYVEPGFTREPLFDEVEVVIIGGGFGGLMAGARLREAGVKQIRVIERGGDFGGTWYWNRYPGAACDIESYIYMPLLEELNYVPKEKYAHAPELLAHCQAIARKFELYDDACFQTDVTGMEWDEAASRWIISTSRGDRMKARFVAMSNGILPKPKLPGLEGIETFKGHKFHTSRWDYNYTGGDSNGNLNKLGDKRVAIIGTGATAVQAVPHLGAAAGHLYVFQRTPSSVDVRNNRPTDPDWVKDLKPGWQKNRMDNFNILINGGDQEEDLVGDGWTDIFRNIGGMLAIKENGVVLTVAEKARLTELADYKKMEQVRARAEEIVKDPNVAEALKPYYRQFCKRPCFHDEYLPTYNRPNVTLVDTMGHGVDRITEKGVMVNGKEYEVDCIIFATGFEVGAGYVSMAGYDIVGRDNKKLSQKWADGLATFHGFYTHGFPNAFFMGITQTGLTANFTHMLNEQANHVAHVVSHVKKANGKTVEPTQEAEDGWVSTMNRMAAQTEAYYAECTPGYYNNEGKPGGGNSFLAGQYGGGPVEFFNILKQWREEGKFEGLNIS